MTPVRKSYSDFVSRIDRDNNMNIVRYVLALGVMIAHFNILCGAEIPWPLTSYDSVSGFFTISGFLLIYPILKGKPLKKYFIDRAWRLLPSYFFIVIIAAFGLSLISTLPAKEYFSSGEFWKYLGVNLASLNFLQPTLPGVFSGQTVDAVNGSLWTIKIEWQLSITMPFIILFLRKYALNLRKSIVVIIIFSLIYRVVLLYSYINTGKEIYDILGRQLIGQLIFFYCGIFIYTYYERFRANLAKILIPCAAIFIFFGFIFQNGWYNLLIYPFILSVLVIGFSLIPKDISRYIDSGHNISYEIYLCHFPIFQLLAYYQVKDLIGTLPTLIAGILLTIAFSVLTYAAVGHLYISRKKLRENK